MSKKVTTILICFTCIFMMVACQGQEGQKAQDKTTPKATQTQMSPHAAEPSYIYGTVKKTMNGGGYTYILLEFEGKDSWVAIPQSNVKVGQEVMLYPGQVMENFHSKSLNKTFDQIIFSQGLVDQDTGGGAAQESEAQAHSGVPRLAKRDIEIEHATGPGAITIAEAYKKAKELDGKQVVLKALVVKVSTNILGKNWLHCQDGTGSSAKNDYDITVTTTDLPKVGEKVLIKGTLHKDKDIGAGYFYPVIIEDAKVKVINK